MDNKAPQTSGLLTSSVNFLSDVLFIVCNILSGTISSWCLEKLSRDSISSIRTKSGKMSPIIQVHLLIKLSSKVELRSFRHINLLYYLIVVENVNEVHTYKFV